MIEFRVLVGGFMLMSFIFVYCKRKRESKINISEDVDSLLYLMENGEKSF